MRLDRLACWPFAAAGIFLIACVGQEVVRPSPAITRIESPASTATSTSLPTPVATLRSVPSLVPVPTAAPTPTPAAGPSATPAPIPTPTAIPVSTLIPTPTPALTPEPTLKPTPVPAPAPTSMPTPTLTPIPSPTPTAQPTAFPGPTATSAPLPTPIRGTGQAVHLVADGVTETYALISGVLGGNPIEIPDCAHPDFGPHITQEWDDGLGKHSFVFHIHVEPDNDRCKTFDRQRNEIKTYDKSPPYLKGFLGDTTTYRWRFKLGAGFQPSTNFTHLHQLKAVGGDDASPLITLTPRAGTPDTMELSLRDSDDDRTVLIKVPLKPLTGVWVEVYERVTFGHQGSYFLEIRNLSTGDLLLVYDDPDIDLWRVGAEFVRPKWGIYRSLNSKEYLRDEQVRFDQFCLAKGDDDCP